MSGPIDVGAPSTAEDVRPGRRTATAAATDPAGHPPAPPTYAAASRRSALARPGRAVASSADAAWTSLLLDAREVEVNGARDVLEWESLPTPDQALVITLGGDYDLECFSGGLWRRAAVRPGVAGLTPGGVTDRLRVHARGAGVCPTLHLFLPTAVFDDAVEHFRRAGTPHRAEPLNALAFHDPVVTHAILGLRRAMEAGAPDLYAATAAQYLATHLLSRHSAWVAPDEDRRDPGPLTDRRLARAAEYMSAHFHESLSLDRLAREAGISKFHFARRFRAATGEAPHAFLVRLRMRAARQLLRDTELGVAEVAAAVGYGSAAQFVRAFRRAVGQSPGAYRAARRRG